MKITVNGKQNEVESGTSIVMLLSQYKIHNPMTIVELNRNVVPREQWDGQALKQGDNIEIIQLMGGG